MPAGAPEVARQLKGRSQPRVPKREFCLISARRYGKLVEASLVADVGGLVVPVLLQNQALVSTGPPTHDGTYEAVQESGIIEMWLMGSVISTYN